MIVLHGAVITTVCQDQDVFRNGRYCMICGLKIHLAFLVGRRVHFNASDVRQARFAVPKRQLVVRQRGF